MDVLKILDKLSSLKLIRVNRQIGNYMNIYCPFHSDGNEHRPSCGVLLHTEVRNGQTYPEGFTHCFTCSYAKPMNKMIDDLISTRNISTADYEWLKTEVGDLSDNREFDSLLPDGISEALMNKYAINYTLALQNKSQTFVSEEELAKYRYTVPYMYERKLTDPIIAEYDIGVDLNWIPEGKKNPIPCITFPVRDIEGRTLFLCRRSIKGKIYNYPQGVTKPVYGIDRVTNKSSVIICESCINALTARTYGYQAVALLGTGNSYQISQLKELGVREYVLCMDGDDAGRRASNKLKRSLCSTSLIWTINMPDGKDLNDLSREEFEELYEQRY